MGDPGTREVAMFAGAAAALLCVAHARYKSPCALFVKRVFMSEHFCDREILLQLCDPDYQTKLAEHNWPELETLGPSFACIAESMLKGMTLEEAIYRERLDPRVEELLIARPQAVVAAMREIAESYLRRNLDKTKKQKKKKNKNKKAASGKVLNPPNGEKQPADPNVVPDLVLVGSQGKHYKPVKFLAKGSAGAVYSAVRVNAPGEKLKAIVSVSARKAFGGAVDKALQVANQATNEPNRFAAAVTSQLQRQLALKRINPTQRTSAENEFRIATLLAATDKNARCVAYLDYANESEEHLWLVLRRINASPYGIDLSEYITCQFFEANTHEAHGYAQSIVLQFLDGVDHISSLGVCMRDVKPDNLLVEQHVDIHGKEEYAARWSDFGLSVDLGVNLDAAGVRSPAALLRTQGCEEISDATLTESLVGFWYDTQKLVPKPRWRHRRPPERCFQNPLKVHASSYDLYMVGIMIVSMATGIDIPHIDKPAVKAAFEEKLNYRFSDDYLETFELGTFLNGHSAELYLCFQTTFGDKFAASLLRETAMMLSSDPRERPRPHECFARLELVANPGILK